VCLQSFDVLLSCNLILFALVQLGQVIGQEDLLQKTYNVSSRMLNLITAAMALLI